jgi:hypothetical protein
VSPVGEPLSVDVDRDLRFRGGFPSDEEEDSPSDEECEEDGRSCSLGVREGDLPLCREEREVERPDLLEERECLEEERACRFEEWEDSCRCSDWVLWCEEEDEVVGAAAWCGAPEGTEEVVCSLRAWRPRFLAFFGMVA